MQLLLDAGADVFMQNKGGETPLFLAARNGCGEVVRLLVDAEFDISDIPTPNNNGVTPRGCAGGET